MPRYFFDTSVLAKVYRKELGSDLIDRIVAEPGSHRFISRFTILEVESDLGSRRILVAIVSDEHLRGARQLLIEHGRTEALRGPDALQLSVALGLKRAGLVSVFVAADQKPCRVAMIEGFTVLNPEQPIAL